MLPLLAKAVSNFTGFSSTSSSTDIVQSDHCSSPRKLLSRDSRAMDRGRVELSIEGISYLLVPQEKNFLGAENGSPLLPATVVPIDPATTISKAFLKSFHQEQVQVDDVLQPSFLEHVIFYGPKPAKAMVQDEANELLKEWGTKHVSFVEPSGDLERLVQGPYVFGQGKTWEAWRIYVDTNSTLMMTFKPAQCHTSTDLELFDSTLTSNQVRAAVPSRCYFRKSERHPLAGMRIVVKDNFDVQGFKTSICSRAWLEYHDPAASTAACVQKLLDKGAVLIGKAKLQAWIMREEPLECVDFLAPFNPRGDGYQTASGSSNGSAAAIGSYSWLDFSIGSDTNGSGRKPAHWNGCMSIRPTHGSIPMAGVTGFWAPFDMPVCYGRDISELLAFAKAWYGASHPISTKAESMLPKSVVVPEDYIRGLQEDQKVLLHTVADSLADVLGVPKTTPFLSDVWQEDLPGGKGHKDIEEYLKEAGCVPYYYDAYYPYRQFYEAYRAKFGKTPFVNRYMRWRWEIHDRYTKQQRDALFQRLVVYKKWLLDKVFKATSSGEIGAIMVLPIENGQPNYRDDLPGEFTLLNGFAPLNISPVTGGPEVTIIAGEIPYASRISNRMEPMPIGVSIAGPPGSDFMLCELAKKALVKANMPLRLAPGRSVYPGWSQI